MIAAITAALTIAGCAGTAPRPDQEINFIIIGNTGPSSPFTGHPEKLDEVYRSINQENPALVVNMGNIIAGGDERVGIMKKDIIRQYRQFLRQKEILLPIMHVTAGEKDAHNGSLALFTNFTGRKLFYSFNYGAARFIIMAITSSDHALTPEQMRWLKRELKSSRSSAAVFVFAHYPLLAPPRSGMGHNEGEELHRLFIGYPVKAVFSGRGTSLHEYERDGIRYVNAGCFGFNYEDWHWSFNQYYRVRFHDGTLTVRGVRVKFSGNSYRPKTIRDEAGTK